MQNLILIDVRELFRVWRENNERKSKDVVDLWESTLKSKVDNLGNESKFTLYSKICEKLITLHKHIDTFFRIFGFGTSMHRSFGLLSSFSSRTMFKSSYD